MKMSRSLEEGRLFRERNVKKTKNQNQIVKRRILNT